MCQTRKSFLEAWLDNRLILPTEQQYSDALLALGLLRPSNERPSYRTAENSEELTPLHATPQEIRMRHCMSKLDIWKTSGLVE
jgi:hypothetical protein